MGDDRNTIDLEALRRELHRRRRVPVSTYRLQLQPAYTFRDAARCLDYLDRLGVTDVYSSPILRARPGSMHGYDVCDFGRLQPDLGTDEDFEAFAGELRRRSMGLLLDFVPNHMAVEPARNRWWRDVLENGPSSQFAGFFDVDWEPVKPELRGKILLPFLGDHYGRVLDRGELRLAREDGGLVVEYFGLTRPLDPRSWATVLREAIRGLRGEPAAAEVSTEIEEIVGDLERLPSCLDQAPRRRELRQQASRRARDRLWTLLERSERARDEVDAAIRAFNGEIGRPESFDRLHEILEAQPYRLAYWRTASHEINYRRFFDIKELAGLRMEDPEVFEATHGLVLRLIREGKVTGLRLDHIDGLHDPGAYLERLQGAVVEGAAADLLPQGSERSREWSAAVASWREGARRDDPYAERPHYVVVEKILTGDESLSASWPVEGTTGYEFLNEVTRLLVDPEGIPALIRVHARFTRAAESFADVVYAAKRLIQSSSLASELNVLAHELNRISEGDRRVRDFTLDSLRDALRETVACFPVYRTYPRTAADCAVDRDSIDLALSRARRRNPAMEPSVFDFLRDVLLPSGAGLSGTDRERRLRFAMRLQQYTGPVQAKGLEDTAFYRHPVLVSLNEVGGDPSRATATPEEFHEANRRRAARWPHGLLSTATHDTKRGEDARARLDALSEIPEEWGKQVRSWARCNARNRSLVDGTPAPDRSDEYLFYQSLLGAWPAEPAGTRRDAAPGALVARLSAYMLKAIREAKVHTSWINPSEAYERGVADFVEKTLAGPRSIGFLAEFLPFQQRLARLGAVNSLAQVALKLTSPGVPDTYQGTELWDLSLVDPDNRGLVDFEARDRMLRELEPLLGDDALGVADSRRQKLSGLLERWHDGGVKLLVTAACLRLRRLYSRVFLEGEYVPVESSGERAAHVISFVRRRGADWVAVAVPRWPARLTGAGSPFPLGEWSWRDTRLVLPPGGPPTLENPLTGERLAARTDGGRTVLDAAEVFATLPVAVLRGRASREPAVE